MMGRGVAWSGTRLNSEERVLAKAGDSEKPRERGSGRLCFAFGLPAMNGGPKSAGAANPPE